MLVGGDSLVLGLEVQPMYEREYGSKNPICVVK